MSEIERTKNGAKGDQGDQGSAGMDNKKGAGTVALSLLGAGVSIAMYAGLMEAVTRGMISLNAAGGIQAGFGALSAFGFGAYDKPRLAASMGASNLALGGGLLIEQFRLSSSQGTPRPTTAPTATTQATASPTVSPAQGLPGGRPAAGYGPSRVNQGVRRAA